MTESTRPLRLWTFYEPMEGPMAVDVNGCYFQCESAEIKRVEDSERAIITSKSFVVDYEYDIEVTFKLRVRSKQDPGDIVYQVEEVPPFVSLL